VTHKKPQRTKKYTHTNIGHHSFKTSHPSNEYSYSTTHKKKTARILQLRPPMRLHVKYKTDTTNKCWSLEYPKKKNLKEFGNFFHIEVPRFGNIILLEQFFDRLVFFYFCICIYTCIYMYILHLSCKHVYKTVRTIGLPQCVFGFLHTYIKIYTLYLFYMYILCMYYILCVLEQISTMLCFWISSNIYVDA